MTVQTLLSLDVDPLSLADTVAQALVRLGDLNIEHLPVVDVDGRLVALVSEDELLAHPEVDLPLGEVRGIGWLSVRPDAHLYDAAALMARHHLSALPIADEDRHYVGLLRRSDLFERFSGLLSAGSPGAVVVLECAPQDYAMSQIAHIAEQAGAKLLSIQTQGQEEPADLGPVPVRITVKLNTSDTARVKHVLEHHGYRVIAAFGEEDTEEEFSYRLQEFLRYLEV